MDDASDYGIGSLRRRPGAGADLLYGILRRRIELEEPRFTLGEILHASRISEETELARATTTKALARLTLDGFLRSDRGRGYEVVSATSVGKATTLLSITRFAEENGYDLVSQIDAESTRIAAVRGLSRAKEVGSSLQIGDGEHVIVLRRARGLRRRRAGGPPVWAILETAYLVAALFPELGQDEVRRLLPSIGTSEGFGNFSLHRYFETRGVHPWKSEYRLDLAESLGEGEQRAWEALVPPPAHPAGRPFYRLSSVTFSKDAVRMEYSVSMFVPSVFSFAMSGFRLEAPGL